MVEARARPVGVLVRLDRCAAGHDGPGPIMSGHYSTFPRAFASLACGVATAWWRITSSKRAGRRNPPVGRFDSCAASLGRRFPQRTLRDDAAHVPLRVATHIGDVIDRQPVLREHEYLVLLGFCF